MKQCTKCNEVKPISEVHVKSKAPDGHTKTCKLCKSKIDKEYRETNKEKLKTKSLEYRHKNKEELSKRRKEKYHSATEEEVKIRKIKKLIYNQNAPEHVKQRKKEYDKKYFASEAGKTTTLKSVHKRRAQKLSTEDGTVTSQALELLKKEQDYKCKYCSEELDFSEKGRVHLDHIVPLSKGGWHSITNVVWSCASCNLRKSNKIINE